MLARRGRADAWVLAPRRRPREAAATTKRRAASAVTPSYPHARCPGRTRTFASWFKARRAAGCATGHSLSPAFRNWPGRIRTCTFAVRVRRAPADTTGRQADGEGVEPHARRHRLFSKQRPAPAGVTILRHGNGRTRTCISRLRTTALCPVELRFRHTTAAGVEPAFSRSVVGGSVRLSYAVFDAVVVDRKAEGTIPIHLSANHPFSRRGPSRLMALPSLGRPAGLEPVSPRSQRGAFAR